MRREDVFAYIEGEYGILPEYPWARTPNYAVFRHPHNRKWFGAIVDVTGDKLGLDHESVVDALNLKCDPLMVGSLRQRTGILPAYHMNKEHWITVLLDSPLPPEDVFVLIDLSYKLTK